MVDQVQAHQAMAWDPEQLTDQANELANNTASHNPGEYPWGVFAWGDAPPACGGGTGCFQWFASLQEALSFISDFSPAMYATFDEEPEWVELRDDLREITSRFEAEPEATLKALNQELKGLLQVEWIGTYDSLCNGMEEFPQKIREWYRNRDEDGPADEPPITGSEEAEFRERLAEYGF